MLNVFGHHGPVQEMRDELTRQGFEELLTPEAVDAALAEAPGTTLLVFNSVCGCAAGGARPGVVQSLQHEPRPQRLLTVFAGQDREATDQARRHLPGFAPSSPSVALLRDGQPVFMLPRAEIEGYTPEQVAAKLAAAYDQYCG